MGNFNPKDHYFKKAKKENFVARSIFKLEELDQKFKILKRGNRVVDLGCAPGSWSQYASKVVGIQGKVIGLDLKEVKISLPNGEFFQADLLDEKTFDLIQTEMQGQVDVVLSDMAPNTTGVKFTDQARSLELCHMALSVGNRILSPGGNFVCKLFESGEFQEFLKELRKNFKKVEILKPKSTRSMSKETFLVGLGFIGTHNQDTGQ